jgi:hypothetical protein
MFNQQHSRSVVTKACLFFLATATIVTHAQHVKFNMKFDTFFHGLLTERDMLRLITTAVDKLCKTIK